MQDSLHKEFSNELQRILQEDALDIKESVQRLVEHRLATLSAKLELTLKRALHSGFQVLDTDDDDRIPALPYHEHTNTEPILQNTSIHGLRKVAGGDNDDGKLTDDNGDQVGATHSDPNDHEDEPYRNMNYKASSESIACKHVSQTSKRFFSTAESNRIPLGMRSIVSILGLDLRQTYFMMVKKRLPLRIHKIAAGMVKNQKFDALISAAIFLNAVFTVISTDWAMTAALDDWRKRKSLTIASAAPIPPTWMYITDLTFSVVFLIELILRMIAEEVLFMCGNNARWNLLDLILVSTSWSDIILDAMGSSSAVNYSFMRLLRVLRVTRSFRVVRVMHLFKDLRVVLLSLLGSVVPLFWALFCVFILIFLFIIVFMQGLAQYVSEQPGGAVIVQNKVMPYFGTFWRTFRTLLMAISGGEDWYNHYQTMSQVSDLFSALFILYICLMTFGTLNVVTAIMVENATSKARQDFEVCKANEQAKLDTLAKQLVSLFEELQPDLSGTITKSQWEKLCTIQDVISYFHMLDIDIHKAQDVWRLLDMDGSNELDVDEFVSGCLHISGSASTVDVESLMRVNQSMLRKCINGFSEIHKELSKDYKLQTSMVLRIIDMLDKQERGVHEPEGAHSRV